MCCQQVRFCSIRITNIILRRFFYISYGLNFVTVYSPPGSIESTTHASRTIWAQSITCTDRSFYFQAIEYVCVDNMKMSNSFYQTSVKAVCQTNNTFQAPNPWPSCKPSENSNLHVWPSSFYFKMFGT